MAELLTSKSPRELAEMFLLCYENEAHYMNLVNTIGLNFFNNSNNIKDSYSVEIYLTDNKDRKTYRQKIGCISLDVFENDILIDCKNRLIRKYELQNMLQPNFDFKLQPWQIKFYNTMVINGFEHRECSEFYADSIMMFIQTIKDVYDGMFIDGFQISSGLKDIKNRHYPEDLAELYISVELQKQGESICSIEDIYRMYQRAKDENINILVIELDDKKVEGVPVYTTNETIQIQNSIALDNEQIGNVRILLTTGDVINVMSDNIVCLYPKYA